MKTGVSPSLIYRKVGLTESQELLCLEERCFVGDRINLRNLRHLLTSPSACCIGVFLDRMLVGSMILLFRRHSHIARIYSLAVSPNARRQGIGKGFVQQAENLAISRDCNRLHLEVRQDNATAIQLYEQARFCLVGEKIGYYEDGADAFVYQKELNKLYV